MIYAAVFWTLTPPIGSKNATKKVNWTAIVTLSERGRVSLNDKTHSSKQRVYSKWLKRLAESPKQTTQTDTGSTQVSGTNQQPNEARRRYTSAQDEQPMWRTAKESRTDETDHSGIKTKPQPREWLTFESKEHTDHHLLRSIQKNQPHRHHKLSTKNFESVPTTSQVSRVSSSLNGKTQSLAGLRRASFHRKKSYVFKNQNE
jgi:hypothetical protein